jgi:Arc/MetJ family transcription regulator
MEVFMRATVALDDELVRKAQGLSGVTERTALLRKALQALIHLEASRRLAAVGGTEPDLEEIKRVRADNPTPRTHDDPIFMDKKLAEQLLGRRAGQTEDKGYWE